MKLNWWWMCGRLTLDRGALRYVLRFGDRGVARSFLQHFKRGSMSSGGVRFCGKDVPWALELVGAPKAVTEAARAVLNKDFGALEGLTEVLERFSGGPRQITT